MALIVRPTHRFDDNWIYIHEPGVQVGRVQNFRSWSPEMVPDESYTCLGLEYFCFESHGADSRVLPFKWKQIGVFPLDRYRLPSPVSRVVVGQRQ